jgi:hypothetical protein
MANGLVSLFLVATDFCDEWFLYPAPGDLIFAWLALRLLSFRLILVAMITARRRLSENPDFVVPAA